MNWTSDDIPPQKGKVAIVTGGNSGMGLHTVMELAAKGATVILATRKLANGESAQSDILERYPAASIVCIELDLASMDSIGAFVGEVNKQFNKIDYLINNAGIMMAPYSLTHDGFESQMGINYVGHFALTGLLLKNLLASPSSRIVTISSSAHKYGNIDFSNLLFEEGRGYSPLKAYARSKLANLLFSYELSRRLLAAVSSTISLAAHPGVAQTNLGRYIEDKPLVKLMSPLWNLMTQSAAMGALPGLRAAVDPHAGPGDYFGPGGFRNAKGFPVKQASSKSSYQEDIAQKLWNRTEELTGIQFSF